MKTINKFGLLLLLILSICSCDKQKSVSSTKANISYAQLPLNVIINQMAVYPTFDEKHVGFTGHVSPQYSRFVRMNELATDTELIRLTNHQSVNVRAYAMWALAKRQHPRLKALINSKITDTALLDHFAGCLIMNESINSFYKSLIETH